MLFGVVPSAKNNDFTARLRHLPTLFVYFFCAIHCPLGVKWMRTGGTPISGNPQLMDLFVVFFFQGFLKFDELGVVEHAAEHPKLPGFKIQIIIFPFAQCQFGGTSKDFRDLQHEWLIPGNSPLFFL